MANTKIEKNGLILEVGLDDLKAIIDEATANIDLYKDEIAVIYEKMQGLILRIFAFIPMPLIDC